MSIADVIQNCIHVSDSIKFPIHVLGVCCDGDYRIMERLYDELVPLMILDPLVLIVFIYVCPEAELPALFARVPSYFATAWLIKSVKDNRTFLKSDVSMLIIVGTVCSYG